MSTEQTTKTYTLDDLIPPNLWAKDHWSTLAYIEDRIVNHGPGYLVGLDPRMRTNRRNLRVFHERGKYSYTGARRYIEQRGQPSMGADEGTLLGDGQRIAGHDDWACVQDFLAAKLIRVWGQAIQPGRTIHLTPLGQAVVASLRVHKSSGGNFRDFRWDGQP